MPGTNALQLFEPLPEVVPPSDWCQRWTGGRHSWRHRSQGGSTPLATRSTPSTNDGRRRTWSPTTTAPVTHDDTIEAADRVAGFLLVGLGQPLTRIVALTVVDVSPDEPVRLTLGTTPLWMPPPLDGLLRDLVATAEARATGWLFAGQSSHMTPARLSERMARLGITNMLSARNAARASLAADTPAVVLAEKLGGSVSAAERWAQAVAAGRDVYTGLLVDDQ